MPEALRAAWNGVPTAELVQDFLASALSDAIIAGGNCFKLVHLSALAVRQELARTVVSNCRFS